MQSDEEDWDYLTKYSVISTFGGKYKMNYDSAITQGILNKVKCKILLIHGMKSQILTKSTVTKIKETKNFDLYEIKYAGHAPALMNFNEISYVNYWLEKLEK